VDIEEESARFRQLARTNTPLQVIRVSLQGAVYPLWLKLEFHNPTGSIKFRTAVGLLASLIAQKQVRPGTRVVESTSGNLGLAMARLLAQLDCQLVAVIDPKMTSHMRRAITDEGASLVLVSEPDVNNSYLLQRLRKVEELLDMDADLRWTDQYHNAANPAIHRDITAAEIFQQTDGGVDAVLAAVSTGGTLAGLSDGLRARRPGTAVIAVDACGSLVTSGTSGAHLLTGIGAARKSDFLFPPAYDHALQIRDVEAFAFCRMVADDTGLRVGGSAGAVFAAFTRVMSQPMPQYRCPVAIISDAGGSYRSTVYSDDWLTQQRVLDQVKIAQARARECGVFFQL
jgi:N-(2-amino-2-carboxyethyl)-L-glutamate synthase